MKIGIDCRLSGSQHAGLGRYTSNLVRELTTKNCQKTDSCVLFFSSLTQAQEVLPKKTSIPCKVVITPIQHYSLREQLLLPLYFYKEKIDLLHVPHFNVSLLYFGKMVVTIHDLLWHEKRGGTVTTLSPFIYWIKYVFYHLVTSTAVKRARRIFVPSKTVSKTLIKYYPKTEKKIVVTKEGTHFLKKSTKTLRKKQQLLYVGSLYPHKNITLVIDALKKMPKVSLKIVGARNVFLDKVKEYVTNRNLQNQVEFLGYVDDDALNLLYAQSTALVQPSLSEGFGLTGLEALSLHTPVLASDIPVFHEIYESAALYFDPHSVESFLSAYKKLKKRSEKTFIRAADNILEEYSWQKMAKKTYTTYAQVYAET